MTTPPCSARTVAPATGVPSLASVIVPRTNPDGGNVYATVRLLLRTGWRNENWMPFVPVSSSMPIDAEAPRWKGSGSTF